MTYCVVGETIATAVDQKPKTSQRLQRLSNIEANPEVSFLVDHYADDWDSLWWVRVDGMATIHFEGETRQEAIEALVARYPQYTADPPTGPVIVITPDTISGWSSG